MHLAKTVQILFDPFYQGHIGSQLGTDKYPSMHLHELSVVMVDTKIYSCCMLYNCYSVTKLSLNLNKKLLFRYTICDEFIKMMSKLPSLVKVEIHRHWYCHAILNMTYDSFWKINWRLIFQFWLASGKVKVDAFIGQLMYKFWSLICINMSHTTYVNPCI